MNPDFGRYTIKRELGRGGMGTVFLAHDTRREHDVALKVLPRTLLHEPGFRDRFDSEIRLIISLEHYAIVPVYDFGEFDGQPYLAMRLMRGGSLADRLANGPLTMLESADILRRICSALDKAHENSIVHRDLKPGNILFDEDGKAYLADFGIARFAEGNQSMTVIGTPQYMAPEQAQGQAVSPRTDVYQMGAVLFQMLTANVPFSADTPTALMFKHVYDPVPPLAQYTANLPPNAQIVVEQAMAKDPAQRFMSTGALANAFASVAREDNTFILPPPIAPPATPSSSAPSQPTKSKRSLMPLLLGLLGLLAVIVVAAVVFTTFAPDSEGEEPTDGVAVVVDTPNSGGGVAAVSDEPTETPIVEATDSAETGTSDTPTQMPTDTPVPTEPPTPTHTPAPTPTPTPDRGPSTIRYGSSVNGKPLEAVRIGNGEKAIVIIGGLHSGYSPSTVELVENMVDHFRDPLDVPVNVTLYIITNANPDAERAPEEKEGRLNANGVDLNRNFGCDWSPVGDWRTDTISGGTAPFSEPETAALRDLILEIKPVAVIFYEARARDGMVTPGECGSTHAGSSALASVYDRASGYATFTDFVLTGDSTNWLASVNIPAISILLKSYESVTNTDRAVNIAAIETVLDAYAR